MPCIRSDPNLNICPDYNSEDFENTRAQLVNENTTEDQVVQLLRNIWLANNNLEKHLWQQQAEQCMEEDKQGRLNQVRIDEEEDARKEEQKKNKFKYIPIQNSGENGEMPAVNDGLDEVSTKKMVDHDAIILSALPDGSTAWVSLASTCSARSVANDEDLPFEEFCQACPRFLVALEEADWPQDRIRMTALFWRNLQIHKYRSL
ncbi:uncharacterized protein HD556DRAFT_1250545 [Suillus plorans]|uniref:Uncharacterized protein n=1 Tax=Suillus plorans TaxID=116603 RepID=A0A9P7D9C1_9AGAM|nr:uncharacterized protein HD556DRAFT_1250545 [Suillus plorans]KAG1784995.1 hypothetical protein HD556DRAFT_1250545 [Suillus plorans]